MVTVQGRTWELEVRNGQKPRRRVEWALRQDEH